MFSKMRTICKIEILDHYYTGLMVYPSEIGLCLGKLILIKEKGWIFKKEISREVEDVWLVMGKGESCDDWVTCSQDYFWGVIKVFDYEEKPLAEQYLKDLKGE